jgi:hypothetical protein
MIYNIFEKIIKTRFLSKKQKKYIIKLKLEMKSKQIKIKTK